MKNNSYLTIVFALLVNVSFAFASLDSTILKKKGIRTCIYVNNKNDTSFLNLFNKSTKIQIVTYGYNNRVGGLEDKAEDLIVDGKFSVTPIVESIILDKVQTDTLFSILYNYTNQPDTAKNKRPTISGADCYFPHHAIVFYKKKKVIACLEICFECSGYRNNNIKWGKPYKDKYCMLNEFFRSIGISQHLRKNCS